MIVKVCPKCKQVLPKEMFADYSETRDILDVWCIDCVRKHGGLTCTEYLQAFRSYKLRKRAKLVYDKKRKWLKVSAVLLDKLLVVKIGFKKKTGTLYYTFPASIHDAVKEMAIMAFKMDPAVAKWYGRGGGRGWYVVRHPVLIMSHPSSIENFFEGCAWLKDPMNTMWGYIEE